MHGTLLGIIALALVLVCLWIWMNILLTRPRRGEQAERRPLPREAGQGPAEARSKTAEQSDQPAVAQASHAEGGQALDSGPAQEGSEAHPVRQPRDLEVLAEKPERRVPRIFDRDGQRPFQLNPVAAPQFEDQAWLECFYQLSEEAAVLGWIAFHNDSVGASDRVYDDEFVDVLRSYQRTVEKLRRQVGLSTVMETSITGEEGKVWFLAPVEDTWLALFVDKTADVERLMAQLLAPVRASDSE